jgi:hypothetical protein
MSLRGRALTVVFLAATAFGALGAPAVAVPMPWETSKAPAVPSADNGQSGTVAVRCGDPCYQ